MNLKNYMNTQVVISLLLCATCFIGDYFVQSIKTSRFLKALCDNLTHGLIGALAAIILINGIGVKAKLNEHEHIFIIIGCFIVSSIIDIDHFIAAKSFNLKDATNLSSRPFLHCTNIPFIIFLILLMAFHFKSIRLNTWIAMIFCGFITHHIRDATRRGFWILPYGHTNPIPYYMYILMTLGVPHLLIYLLNTTKYKTEYKLLVNV